MLKPALAKKKENHNSINFSIIHSFPKHLVSIGHFLKLYIYPIFQNYANLVPLLTEDIQNGNFDCLF